LACARVESENLDAAGVSRPESLENLNGGGFACSVGTEQCKDLAFGNGEADAPHRRHAAIRLAKILDLDGHHEHVAVVIWPEAEQ
jgi:hypothetical protein